MKFPIGTVTFLDWKCTVWKTTYTNGRIALFLTDDTDGEPVATASVNLPEEVISEGEATHTFIKDYSENEGILEVLFDAGYISPVIRSVNSGWIMIPLVKVLI